MEITIIGGGITGLTTAIALQKKGLQAVVYERAESLNEIGAGIWIQPNAIQVFDKLGLKTAVEQVGFKLSKMEITNSQLKPYKKIVESIVADRFGNQTVSIKRSKLQRILYDTFVSNGGKVEFGCDYETHSENNSRVTVRFCNNSSVSSDILLGADGIFSKVRTTLGFEARYRDSGQICWRGVSKIDMPDYLYGKGKEAWGKRKRFGFSQISNGEVYFFAVLSNSIAKHVQEKEDLSKCFSNFHQVIKKCIENTSPMHTTKLQDFQPIAQWSRGLTCLIGDAAHATTPNMGQGASQGIEDAYALAEILPSYLDRPEQGFYVFQQARFAKAQEIIKKSWMFGQLAHHPIGQLLFKASMPLTPSKVIKQQMEKLFEIPKI